MRKLITALFLTLTTLVRAWTWDAFPDTEPVKFSFVETYDDVVVPDPDFPDEYLVVGRNLVDISGSAPLALTADQLAEIDEFTDFEIDVGDFNFIGSLGDDDTYDSFTDDRDVSIPIDGFDENGNDIRIGTIALRWSATRVIFTARIVNAPEDYWIASVDYYPGVDDDAIDRDDLLAAFTFGDFSFDTRTAYLRGTAKVNQVDRDGTLYDVSEVRLTGSIDSVVPTAVITQPAAGVSTITVLDVTDGKYTISGTSADTRMVGTETFPGKVTAVSVQFGPQDNPGPFVPANLDPNTGNWFLPNAPVEAGKNSLIVRVTDEHGNVGFTAKQTITYTSSGDLTVTAAAEGYGPEDNGKMVGLISGAELAGTKNQFPVIAGVAPTVNKRTGVESGQIFRVIATPEPGTSFNGWTGEINGVTRFTGVSQVLDFETKPGLIVTAHFVPNPFGPIAGIYHGILSGDSADERGTLLITVKNTGSFTGKVAFGPLSIPLKGTILGGGHWSGPITKNGKQFTLAFDLNVTASGDRLLTGTLTGENVASTYSADRVEWRKPKKSDPGNTAQTYVGTYNVILPASSDNTDPNFPNGIGYGRVKIGNLGEVLFVGKLGDGSTVKSTAVLVKRDSGAVFFNLFVPLDKKLGSCVGSVFYDATKPDTDLGGSLDWSEPASKGVEPSAFGGKIAVFGSRYVKPPAGTRVMLQAENGNGRLRLLAPSYTKPAKPVSFPLFIQANPANLTTANKISPVGAEKLNAQFSSKSGLFHGSYKDPDLKKTVSFFGAVVQKMNGGSGFAGGVFVRGNRAGYVEFTSPPP